ncbi:MAG: class I SAM-dependent methyltransferase [Planctomycetota bacterium]
MIPSHTTDEWAAIAEAWLDKVERHPEAHRVELLDGPMLEAVGDVAGKRVIDLGCGGGRFCRMLAERGAAEVVGVDQVAAFIDYARAHGGPREKYVVADAQRELDWPAGSFDAAVSYLALMDMPDPRSAIRESARLVRPGGALAVCVVHPMRSSTEPPAWVRDDDGRRLHWPVADYGREGPRTCDFGPGVGIVTNFHVMLSTYAAAFTGAGFAIEAIVEPLPTPEQAEASPGWAAEYHAPNFMIFRLRRSNASD